MIYEIQSKSDFQTGVTLVVRVHEEEIDKKALYTISAEHPDFLLPFRHRLIDGQVEFTYQIGNRSKIKYLSGSRSPSEYADLWVAILQPLLDCGDWFMNPFSFVLDPEYLFWDKKERIISFIYIPSIRSCSDFEVLKKMVTEVAKQNQVTDIGLENKVVWAIQDFNPTEFLEMMKSYKTLAVSKNPQQQVIPQQQGGVREADNRGVQPEPNIPKPASTMPGKELSVNEQAPPIEPPKLRDEISINILLDRKKEKPNGKLFGSKLFSSKKREKEEKQKSAEKGRFWRKEKGQPQEILQGAAAEQNLTPEHPLGAVHTPQNYISPIEIDDDATQLDIPESNMPKFRYVGSGDHPKIIEVFHDESGIFTIGRFDASIGAKQSSFEFDKKTKAVSRRHAAVEYSVNGFSIVDLGSSAGTFINGKKIPPNAPFRLNNGDRVSFGHSGADYIWEE